ncbi:MAG: hypothetical protein K0R54_647 [Clostridiaceae bacterium]|jgi:hypothetical protein|nr:hypothetical protein [Clostridiaceae bacterium]
MKINDFKDLILIKNALENYIPKIDEMVNEMKKIETSQRDINSVEENVIRGKKLISYINDEFNLKLKKIASGDLE